jgi:hypothetical protein
LYDYHISIQVFDWFGERAKLQPTWSKLIRMLFSYLNEPIDTEKIRNYQSEHLGRLASNTCLLELLPLPARSTRLWDYSKVSNLPYLSSRDVYREEIGAIRAKNIRSRINQHKPKLVVFYSTSRWYVEKWASISGNRFEEEGGVQYVTTPDAVFGIVKHPTSMGIPNQYFHNAGKILSGLISK